MCEQTVSNNIRSLISSDHNLVQNAPESFINKWYVRDIFPFKSQVLHAIKPRHMSEQANLIWINSCSLSLNAHWLAWIMFHSIDWRKSHGIISCLWFCLVHVMENPRLKYFGTRNSITLPGGIKVDSSAPKWRKSSSRGSHLGGLHPNDGCSSSDIEPSDDEPSRAACDVAMSVTNDNVAQRLPMGFGGWNPRKVSAAQSYPLDEKNNSSEDERKKVSGSVRWMSCHCADKFGGNIEGNIWNP